MRDALDRYIRAVLPHVEGHLRISSEGDDRIDGAGPHRVEELVAPGLLLGLGEKLVGRPPPARVERVWKRVHEEVRARQAELGQEALDALAGVTDQRAVRDALRRPRVGGDAEQPRRPVEAAPIEDRPPRRPEGLRLARPGAAQADRGDRLRRPPVELRGHVSVWRPLSAFAY